MRYDPPALLPVFYTPKMVPPSDRSSPSPAKPAPVVASWLTHGLPIVVIEPEPATVEELSAAHDPEFVRAVLEGRSENGFGNRSPEVAASLPYTSGAMLSAARWVLVHGGAAAAPCSGFHHAGYDYACLFCTFNGLMVTASVLRREGKVQRIGIVDCDQHYGDGTDEIISMLHAHAWVRHFSAGSRFHRRVDVGPFFDALPGTIASMRDVDLILYQAGADPHIDDPGHGWLTTAELRQRDAIVFEVTREIGVPLVWNLAGGYQQEPDGSIPKLLEIHDNTAREWVRVFGPGTDPRAT